MRHLHVVSFLAFLGFLAPPGAHAQEVGKVAGTVTDRATGAPLAGAQVTVVGTRLVVVTDAAGHFSLDAVPAGTVALRARTIGYGSAEQSMSVGTGEAATADFQLQPQAVELEGVVVVGYGTQRRDAITGAVASVTSDQFVEAPTRDAASLIAGKIPGLAVTTPSGNPTAGTEITLRGTPTIQGPRSPLVLVDGIPGNLSTVAPQDIESIDVLKDGSAATNYTGALTYDNRQGIFRRSDDHQLTGRVHVAHTMYGGHLLADLNMLTRVENSFWGPDYNYAWRQTLIRNPTDRVLDDQGMWQERGTYFYVNPLGLINEDNGSTESRNLRLHGTLTLMPVNKLRLSVMGGTERGSVEQGDATTFRHVNTTQNGQDGTAYRYSGEDASKILEMTGTYGDRIGGHNYTLLGGYSYQDFENDWFWFRTYDFPTDLFGTNRLQSGDALAAGKAGVRSFKSSYKVIGFFGRLNYDWDNRFLLMGSLRYEGNSKFGANHKWGLFPAISGGWRVSREGFMRGAPFVNDLKLRLGYGVTGIAPDDAYLSLTSYTYGSRFLYNGDWVQGLSPTRNPNPDLRWERKGGINLGADFSLFDYRLAGSLDL